MRHLTSYARVQRLIGAMIRSRSWLQRMPVRRYLDIGCGPNTHDEFVNLDWQWHPRIDVCWDVAKGLPFPDGAFAGVFSEHCLEHFSFDDGLALLRECRRVLAPEGTLRLVVPDGELYLRRYASGQEMPYATPRDGIYSPILSVNGVFIGHGHRLIYDFELARQVLERAGFTNIRRVGYGEGTKPLLIDTQSRAVESLYVEAQR